MLLNEATFLDNLKTRYYKDKIYVSIRNENERKWNHVKNLNCRHMWPTY